MLSAVFWYMHEVADDPLQNASMDGTKVPPLSATVETQKLENKTRDLFI